MNSTLIEQQNQTINPEKLGIFGNYFSRLKVGSMLNKSGIIKTKGASPLELFTIVFNLAFMGKNFFEGVVRNKKIDVGKDAVYGFLNHPHTTGDVSHFFCAARFIFSSKIFWMIFPKKFLFLMTRHMIEAVPRKWNFFPVYLIIQPTNI